MEIPSFFIPNHAWGKLCGFPRLREWLSKIVLGLRWDRGSSFLLSWIWLEGSYGDSRFRGNDFLINYLVEFESTKVTKIALTSFGKQVHGNNKKAGPDASESAFFVFVFLLSAQADDVHPRVFEFWIGPDLSHALQSRLKLIITSYI